MGTHFNKFFDKRSKYFLDTRFSMFFLNQILEIKSKCKVLDLGCGDGKHSLFLASKGFDVTAVDISDLGIKKLKENARKLKLKINILKKDILDFDFKENYNVILCINVLHFFERQNVESLLKKIKTHTNKGGINFISAFVESETNKKFPFTFKKNELLESYKDWKILNYHEKLGELNNHGEKPHRHLSAILLAQKK